MRIKELGGSDVVCWLSVSVRTAGAAHEAGAFNQDEPGRDGWDGPGRVGRAGPERAGSGGTGRRSGRDGWDGPGRAGLGRAGTHNGNP